jgi:hypothetical protein|tara:strand:- start:1587 stop:1865 length:279 start_codon:yes stop_codon:yes gene_type:complete
MDELMDILANDDSAAQASDKIKDILFAKSAEKIDDIRPNVAASLFDQDVDLDDGEETVDEFESDVELDDEEDSETSVADPTIGDQLPVGGAV